MIEKIHIENYKSISSLDLELGRVTVLIGENGSGKSNILEAIAFAAAASQNKLDNEFLSSRGIRVSSPQYMRATFDSTKVQNEIFLSFTNQEAKLSYILTNDNEAYSSWEIKKIDLFPDGLSDEELDRLNNDALNGLDIRKETDSKKIKKIIIATAQLLKARELAVADHLCLDKFMIFSPENTALRKFEKEAQIEPLGVNGEGLYKLLKVTSETEPEKISIVKDNLSLIGWFKNFELPESQFRNLEIVVKDKYIQGFESELYNHKNTNEGFLFLLFYILLLVSDKTPKFFAIDNIDASLNPKLCTELTRKIVQLAKEYDKQVILTTHNPAILDGINLHDEEQKILVVSRNKKGHTKVRSVKPPRVPDGEIPVKLSEAFLNGMIGGLPKNF